MSLHNCCLICEMGNEEFHRVKHPKEPVGLRVTRYSKTPFITMLQEVLDQPVTADMLLCTGCSLMLNKKDYNRQKHLNSVTADNVSSNTVRGIPARRGGRRGRGGRAPCTDPAYRLGASTTPKKTSRKPGRQSRGNGRGKQSYGRGGSTRSNCEDGNAVRSCSPASNISTSNSEDKINGYKRFKSDLGNHTEEYVFHACDDEEKPAILSHLHAEYSSDPHTNDLVNSNCSNLEFDEPSSLSSTTILASDVINLQNSDTKIAESVELIKTEILDNVHDNWSISPQTEAVHFISEEATMADLSQSSCNYSYNEDLSHEGLPDEDENSDESSEEEEAEEENFRCPCCPRSFVSANGLKKHHLSMHIKTRRVRCQLCPHIATSDRTIETHMRDAHDKTVQHSCDFCDKDFILKSSLQQHIRIIHKSKNIGKTYEKRNAPRKRAKHICPSCNGSFHGKKALTAHNKEVHGGEKYKCKYCPFQSNSTRTLSRHDAEVHKKNNFIVLSCALCETSCSSVQQLEEHCVKVHMIDKIHHCNLCGDSFATSDMLRFHIKSHNPYNCSLCHLGFKKQDSLRLHVETVHNHDEHCQPAAPAVLEVAESMPSLPAPDKGHIVVTSSHERSAQQQLASALHTADTSALPVDTTGTETSATVSDHSRPYDKDLAEEYLKKSRSEFYNDRVACIFCPKQVSFGHLRSHFRQHSGEAPYACKYCPKKCIQSTNLRKHMRNKHPDEFKTEAKNKPKKKAMACDTCGIVCEDFQQLEIHLWQHMSVKPFQCNLCYMKFGMQSNLNEHMKTHYYKDPVICKFCKRKFVSIGYFEEHEEKCRNKWKCSTCNEYCENETSYRKHQKFAHPTEETNKFCCSEVGCDKVFYEKHRYADHMITHDKEKKFKCLQCPKKFKRKRPLLEHISNNHDLRCNECSMALLTLQELIQHRTNKHLHQLHTCNICGLILVNKKTLKNHQHIDHPQDDNFELLTFNESNDIFASELDMKQHCLSRTAIFQVCSVFQCYNTFDDTESFVNHMNDAHSDISYSCAFCQADFFSEMALTKHILEFHDRLHSCSECKKIFYSKEYLDKHSLLHSSEQKYCCNYCDYFVPSRFWLISHMKQEHPECTQQLLMREQVYSCSSCQQHYRTHEDITMHIEQHTSCGEPAHVQRLMIERQLMDDVNHDDGAESSAITNCPCCGVTWPDLETVQQHLAASPACTAALHHLAAPASTNEEGTESVQYEASGESPVQFVMLDKENEESVFVAVQDDKTVFMPFSGDGSKDKLVFQMNDESGGGGGGQLMLYQAEDEDGNSELVVGEEVCVSQEERKADLHGRDAMVISERGQELGPGLMTSDQLAALLANSEQIIISQQEE